MQDNLYNLAIERNLLITAIENRTLLEGMNILKDTDFYLPSHQDIFIELKNLAYNSKPIDKEFLKIGLLANKKFDEQVFLEIEKSDVVLSQNISEYILLLKDKGFKRDMLRLTTEIKRVTVEEELPAEEVLQAIETKFERLKEEFTASLSLNLEEENILDVDDVVCYKTSIKAFNSITGGGLAFPYFYLLNGVKHAGKTAGGIQILKDLDQQFGTHFISLEMHKVEVGRRFKTIGKPSNMSFDFDSYEISDIIESIKKAHAKGKRVFLIDSIMKIKNRKLESRNNRAAELADIASQLAIIKNKLNISIILITQAANSTNGILTTKGSGDVDYEADAMLQIAPTGFDSPRREWMSTKNRINGVMGKAYADFSKDTLLFTDSRN